MSEGKNIDEITSRVLDKWGQMVMHRLAERLKAQGLVLSADLLRSLEFEVVKAAGDHSGAVMVAFEEYGRIREMKGANWKKQPPIEVIEEFIAKIGVSKFQKIPGYSGKGKMPTEKRAINRLAWAISRSRLKNIQKKPPKWFQKPFYGMLDPLIEQLAAPYIEEIVNTAKSVQKNG